MERSEVLEPLLAAPEAAAVLVDFDGTLSPIVEDPGDARPLPGVVEALRALAGRYAVVGVVSGRPLAFLEEHLPVEITLSGLYGIEWRRAGVRGEHPTAGPWRPVVDEVVDRARRELPPEVEVEAKGSSLTLHVRRHPERTGEAHAWADAVAAATGLVVRPAKRSVELHPPVSVDKGTVVEVLVGPLGTACFIGDDVGDLPAFEALDRLEAAGCRTARIVVESPEVVPDVLAKADLVVPGPEGALALLRDLLPED